MKNIQFITYKDEYLTDIYKFVFNIMVKDVKKDPKQLKIELKDLENINKTYIKKNGCFYIAINNENKVVGTIGLIYKRGRWEIKRFYIDASYRGKGIGKKLYSMVENNLKNRNIDELYIVVGNNLKIAKEIYIKWGFFESKIQNDKNNTELKKILKYGNN